MSNCPNCGQKLHFWNIKAECPHCGANIPNHDWESRLDADALAREAAFFKMHSNLSMLKFATVGNVLRIIRLAAAFLPIIGFVLPLFSFTVTDYGNVIAETDGFSVISIFTVDEFGIGKILSDEPVSVLKKVVIALAASLLLGVVAFFLIPILFKRPKQPATLICHLLAAAAYSFNLVLIPQIFGEGGSLARSGSIRFGLLIGIALFALSIVMDIAVLIARVAENDGRYVPKKDKDELQYEYAVSIGAINEEE